MPFIFRLLLTLLAWLLLVPVQAGAKGRVLRLADYGILPNSPSDRRLCTRLDSVLRLLRAATGEGEAVTLRLERGTYHLYAPDAIPRELYISNHDQGQPKRTGIYIKEWDGLTLDGRGAEIICHGRMLPLAVTRSRGVTIKRLAIDFDQPQITQVQVVKNPPAEGITFAIDPLASWRIGGNGKLETVGEGWTLQPSGGIAFDPDTHHILYGTGDLSVPTDGCRDLGGGHVLAPLWKNERLRPGTIVALRTWERPAPGIFIDGDTDTRLTDVTIHYAEGMGLLAQRCHNVTLRRFNVCLRGHDDPRYFTTQADATHFSQCSGLISVRGGLYEGMMDDAINVHGIYLRIASRPDARTLRCTYGHSQAWGFGWGEPGDTVAFVRAATMESLPQQAVIATIRPDGQDSVAGCKGFVLTFTQDLPPELAGVNLFGIEDLTQTPEVDFSRNIVRNNRARGALFSSPRRTVCSRNLFDHVSGSAILLCGDCNGWFESGAVRSLAIRRNTFRNALTSLFQFTEAVISICPEVPQPDGQAVPFHGGTARAIRIEHNYFDSFPAPLLYAKSVSGLTFLHNQLRRQADYPALFPDRPEITLTHCRGTHTESARQVK